MTLTCQDLKQNGIALAEQFKQLALEAERMAAEFRKEADEISRAVMDASNEFASRVDTYFSNSREALDHMRQLRQHLTVLPPPTMAAPAPEHRRLEEQQPRRIAQDDRVAIIGASPRPEESGMVRAGPTVPRPTVPRRDVRS